jgi:hypothetical protein
MSHTITNETWDLAQDWLTREVSELLDDPDSWGLDAADFRAEVDRLRRVATDLAQDFDALVRESGTEYEQERLRKLLEE